MKLPKVLIATKMYSKEMDSSRDISTTDKTTVCSCLKDAGTVNSKLVTAMCCHFGMLISEKWEF